MNENLLGNEQPRAKLTVARFLEQQFAISDKSQREIAKDMGYTNPNVLTMFKLGDTKLPVNRVCALADALDIDPAYLLRLVMSEYMADTWDSIEQIFGSGRLVTKDEISLLRFVRELTGGVAIDLERGENRSIIGDAFRLVADADQAQDDASIARYKASPPNQRSG